MCHKKSLSTSAGLQVSVVKICEILNKYGVTDLEDKYKVYLTGVIESIIYDMYKFIGNHTKVSKAKRISYEHLISIANTTKSDIFSQALVELELTSTTRNYISMHDGTYKVMKQSHPDLSVQTIVSTYMDLLIDIYCERISQLDLTNLEGSIEKIFGKDDALCDEAIDGGKTAVNYFIRSD